MKPGADPQPEPGRGVGGHRHLHHGLLPGHPAAGREPPGDDMAVAGQRRAVGQLELRRPVPGGLGGPADRHVGCGQAGPDGRVAGHRHIGRSQPRPQGGADRRDVTGLNRGVSPHGRRAHRPDDGPVGGRRSRDHALQRPGAQRHALPRDRQAGQYGDEHQQAEGDSGGGPGAGQRHPRRAQPQPQRSHPASARNCAAGSGRRRTDRAAAATGTAAVTRAKATAGPNGTTTRAHGTGVTASAVRVIAGTSS